jgi:hypothetical protein
MAVVLSVENTRVEGLGQFSVRLLDSVISSMECWNPADVEVSGRILRIWMPAIHAGMTKLSMFMFCARA